MNDYSRSDYLRALLNQKKSLSANSNSLVNPSIPQANNIGDLAALDTSFSGTSSTTMPDKPQEQTERNWWQRTIDTASEFVNNISEGVLGFVDGLVDTGGYLYGAFSGDHKGAQEFMNYDWEAQTLNALNQLDVASNILTGDIFTEDYWNDWATVGSAEASRQQLNQMHQNSWTSELGAEGQQIYNSITQGIGSALPSVALAIATGGASAATMFTLGTSAFGNAAGDALNDGASYGQAGLYGAASAGIEMLTEIGSDLLTKGIKQGLKSITINGVKMGAKEAIKSATQKGFQKIATDTIKNMVAEGMEEVVSSALNPVAKMIYKGESALEEYTTPEFYTELVTSFVGGAAGALVGGKVQKAHLVKTYSKTGVDAIESFNTAHELQQEYNEQVAKGGNVTELSQEYGALYSEQIQNGIQQLEQLQKTNPKAFEKVIKAMRGETSIDETTEQTMEGIKATADATMTQRYAKDIASRIGVDINLVDDNILQSAETFQKATGIQLTQEQVEQFNNQTEIKKGLNINGKTYISNKYEANINQMIMHEAVSHGYMDSNQNLRDGLLNSLRANKDLRTKINNISAEVYKSYGLNKQQVTRIFDNTSISTKTIDGKTMNSETMAKLIEFLYSDNNISSVLNTLNKSKIRSMLTRAVNYLKTKGDSTKQARLQIEKTLSKIKLDKEQLENSGLKFAKLFRNEEKQEIKKDLVLSEFQKKTFSEQLELYEKGEMPYNERFCLGVTPKILINNGATEFKLVLSQETLKKITGIHHMPLDIVKQIPEAMETPYLVLKSNAEEHKNRLIEILELKDDSGREILVPVKINSHDNYVEVSEVLTSYGKKGLNNWLLNKDRVVLDFYNEKRTSNWLASRGLQLSKLSNTGSSFTYSISETNQNSNTNNVNSTQNTKNTTIVSTSNTSIPTTNTTPEVNSTTYSNFFTVDGKINADWVKRGARANYGKTIDLKDSRFIIDVALDTLHRNFNIPNEVKLSSLSNITRKFFEAYNVSDGEILRSKAYEQLLNDLLQTNVTITETGQKIKLQEFLISNTAVANYTSIKQFKKDFTALINDMIDSYGKPTEIQKVFDRLTAKIEQIKQQTTEQVKNIKLSYKNVDIARYIKNEYDDHRVKAYTGTLFPELTFIRDLARGIQTSDQTDGISGSSIDHIIESFEKINYTKDSETLATLGLEFNQEWFDMVQYFKNKLVIKNGELKSKNRKLTLQENQMINKFLNELKQILKDRITEKELELRQRYSKYTSELNIVLNRTNIGQKEPSFFLNELNYTTSPDVLLGRMLGFNSGVLDVLYNNPLHAYIQQQYQEQKFKDEVTKIVKKYDIEKKLERSTTITVNGKVYPITYKELANIYCHSLAQENRKNLIHAEYSYKHNGRKVAIQFTEETLNDLVNLIPVDIKNFAQDILDYYNTDLKEYAKSKGIEVLKDEIYYPLGRSDVANTEVELTKQNFRALHPDTLPVNQQRVKSSKPINGMGILEQIGSYIGQVTKVGEMGQAMDEYSKFLNTKVYDGNGVKVSRNELLQRISGDWQYIKSYIEYQFAGIIPSKIQLANDKVLNKLFQNAASATLGANISPIMKQTTSKYMILAESHLSSWLKGTLSPLSTLKGLKNFKETKALLLEKSPLMYKKLADGEFLKATGFTANLSWLSKKLMIPMELMDEAINIIYSYNTAYYEAKLELKGTNPTEVQIQDRAIQILERIVMNTQSHHIAPKMSMARSGHGGFLRKSLSVFTADLNNKINIIRKTLNAKKVAKANVKSTEKLIEKTQSTLNELLPTIPNDIQKQIEELKLQLETLKGDERKETNKKLVDLQEMVNEKESYELELENLKKILEENKVIAEDDEYWKQITKMLAILAMQALNIAVVTQIVDRILGRVGWDENTLDDFLKDLLLESTIYNLPYMQTIGNSIEYDKEIGTFELTSINSTLSTLTDIGTQLATGNYKGWYTNLYNVLGSIGTLTGIPFKNMYNVFMGVWKNLDPSGYEFDAIIKGYSDNYILQQYKEAVNVGRNKQADGYLDILMKNNKVSTTSATVQKELVQFTKDGYNALPKNFMLGYTDENDKQVKLTEDQILQFRKAYNTSNKAVEGLLNVTEYKTLTQEEKAKLVKKIYDTYYAYARAKTLKQNKADNKLASLLLYTNGNANISKYVSVLNIISSIKESKTKTRKQLVIEYVNKLSGYSKQEKLLILHLAGYKTTDTNVGALSSYLRQSGMDYKQVNTFLGVE